MRGADLEPSHTLLEHLRRRIAALAVELGTADDDGRLWGWGADLAADVDRARRPARTRKVCPLSHASGLEVRGKHQQQEKFTNV